MSRVGLTPEQNERVRTLLRGLLDKGETQVSLAPKLGLSQSGLSSFLSNRAGTTYVTVGRVAKLLHMAEWEVLGEKPPKIARQSPREMAAELAREIGVSERAIADVLAEPIEGREGWYALWWADRMRKRDLELMPGPEVLRVPHHGGGPAAPAPEPAQPEREEKSGVSVKRIRVPEKPAARRKP